MSKTAAPSELSQLVEHVTTIVDDAKTLLGQQAQLLRAEAREELHHVGASATALATGAGLALAGGAMGGVALVHVISRVTRLPLWASYGLAATGLIAGGAAYIRRGREELSRVELLPKSAEALQENLEWLQSPASP